MERERRSFSSVREAASPILYYLYRVQFRIKKDQAPVARGYIYNNSSGRRGGYGGDGEAFHPDDNDYDDTELSAE